ncbi:MAG: hypothetical protein ABSD82_09175 [Solirubrobacteraceae bacterium]|jgi:hypothetical protein
MTHESYKPWLDEMPIDDVRRRIERLEQKLADLQVLERLYGERHGDDGDPPGAGADHHDESAGEGEVPSLGEAEPSEEDSGGEHEQG